MGQKRARPHFLWFSGSPCRPWEGSEQKSAEKLVRLAHFYGKSSQERSKTIFPDEQK